jgi:hypothetical protein
MLTGEKRPVQQQKIRSATTIKNAGLVMVNVFINGHSPPDKRVHPKRKVASPHDQLPPPALPINGVEYGVGEFLGNIQLY